MKTNQKGFSVVEVLVVIVVVGLIGVVGWLVYDRQKSKTSNTQPQSTAETNPANSKEKLPNGWLKYDKSNYTFLYPDTWTVDSANQDGSIILTSADYKAERKVEAQKPYYLVSAGYLLEISEIPNSAPNETIEKLTAHVVDEEKMLGGGSHEQITVDGKKALWVNNKHGDTYLYVIVFHDGKRTHIQLNSKDDSDSESAKLLDDILASFKFQ
jgi:prepilin-type N-terminal cleavage/methylation domain-containing protein